MKRLKTVLWELCKQITRRTHGNTCFTCGKRGLEGSSWQTGHFLPSGSCGLFLRYDLRNLRPQCYHCNINLGGNGAVFYSRLLETEGRKYVEQLFRDKQRITKADRFFFEAKIVDYQAML